jgi:transposase
LRRSKSFDLKLEMVALSEDLRRRIIDGWKKKGLSTEELAERFDVGTATVKRLKRAYRETGSIEPKGHGGGNPRRISVEQEPLVEALVQKHPDWTEAKYAEVLQKEHGIRASAVTVGRVIRRLGYSVKKNPSLRTSATSPTSSASEPNTKNESETSPLHVWFLWTKRARTLR